MPGIGTAPRKKPASQRKIVAPSAPAGARIVTPTAPTALVPAVQAQQDQMTKDGYQNAFRILWEGIRKMSQLGKHPGDMSLEDIMMGSPTPTPAGKGPGLNSPVRRPGPKASSSTVVDATRRKRAMASIIKPRSRGR